MRDYHKEQRDRLMAEWDRQRRRHDRIERLKDVGLAMLCTAVALATLAWMAWK